VTERFYRHYEIATYEPAPSLPWRRTPRPATRGWLRPEADSSLEVVNGSHQLPSRGALSKPPWGA
jgi:hypothetical protein